MCGGDLGEACMLKFSWSGLVGWMRNSFRKKRLAGASRHIAHLVIVPDGDRRWAKEKGLPGKVGHEAMARLFPEIVDGVFCLGIHTLTLSLFSTENWDRDPKEIAYLMEIFFELIGELESIAAKHNAAIVFIGRRDRIPKKLADLQHHVEDATKDLKNHILNIAIDYGAFDELQRALQKIVSSCKKEDILGGQVLVADYLDTARQPHPFPDLFIRFGKVQRISGFLPLQGSYAEFCFPPLYFPDATVQTIYTAIEEFGRRKRTFGK